MYISGIAFDAFGTLIDLEALRDRVRAAVGAVAAGAVFDGFKARLVPWMWHATTSDRYRPFPEIARFALLAATQEAGARLSEPVAAELVGAMTSLPAFAGTGEALEVLAGTAPLAVLSNGTIESLAALVAHAHIADRFAYLLSADSVRRFKPAPEVYHLASSAFNAPPERTLLVASHEWDVSGARQAGLRTAWLSHGRRSAPVFGLAADIVVEDITALPAALQAWQPPDH